MENIIIVAILVLILGGASLYIFRAKKRGVKCIGCPDGATCSGHCAGCGGKCGGCGGNTDTQD